MTHTSGLTACGRPVVVTVTCYFWIHGLTHIWENHVFVCLSCRGTGLAAAIGVSASLFPLALLHPIQLFVLRYWTTPQLQQQQKTTRDRKRCLCSRVQCLFTHTRNRYLSGQMINPGVYRRSFDMWYDLLLLNASAAVFCTSYAMIYTHILYCCLGDVKSYVLL